MLDWIYIFAYSTHTHTHTHAILRLQTYTSIIYTCVYVYIIWYRTRIRQWRNTPGRGCGIDGGTRVAIQGEGSVAMAGNSSSASGGGGKGGSAPVLPRATSASGSPAFGTDSNGRGARETGRRAGCARSTVAAVEVRSRYGGGRRAGRARRPSLDRERAE